MPQALTHILVALIIGSLIRDYVIKDKKKFPLHYVLIIGIAGALADFDIALYWVMHWFGADISEVHRTFTHNIFVPLVFLGLSLISWKLKNKTLGKHHLKLHTIFWAIAIGCFMHLLLDFILIGKIMPFYPFSSMSISLNLVNYLPYPLNNIFLPSIDAALLILWLVYIEWKHKISDFI